MASMALILRCGKQRKTTALQLPKTIIMAITNTKTAVSPGHLLNGEAVRRISPRKQSNTLKIHRKNLKIATWNVRSMFQAGRLENVTTEMQRMQIDILGVSEVRWLQSGKCDTENGTLYYAGRNDNLHRDGVGIILSKELNKHLVSALHFSERLILLQLQTALGKMNIIQVYAPTLDKEDTEIEAFYSQLDEILALLKPRDITIIMGDFNAKIGQGEAGEWVGKYGLGKRNERGDRLLQFCIEKDLTVTNTHFKLHPRRLYTWRSPGDSEDKIVRNQIDYILIRKQFKNGVTSVKTYPGADVASDHNPVVMMLNVRLKSRKSIKPSNKTIDILRLRDPEVLQKATTKINEDLSSISINTNTNINAEEVNDDWNKIKNVFHTTQNQIVGTRGHVRKNKWMTTEILTLIEKRRAYKNRKEREYQEIQKVIKQKIRQAKEQHLMERCNEIEDLQKRHDSFNVHKKIREMVGTNNNRKATILKDSSGKIILDLNDKLKRWKEYVMELFNDSRPDGYSLNHLAQTGPDIQNSEVKHAINITKTGKAAGPDGIYSEMLKLVEDDKINILTDLMNTIYKTGVIPHEWLTSTFITLPKKPHATDCNDYRMISLMSHTLKVFLRIIHTRMYRKCEAEITDTQFGFRNGFGTREALQAFGILVQRCQDVNKDVYACYIDYSKAFDNVRHEKLINILTGMDIDYRDIRIVSNLYWGQTAKIKIENELSEDINIRKGVRQGCVLSPMLFNIYSESIFRETLSEDPAGIVVNGKTINNIRYADDTVVLADNITDLTRMMNSIEAKSKEYGLQMNLTKTKTMIISKTKQQIQLVINGKHIEQVSKYKYLGTWLNDEWSYRQEILARIEQARAAFVKMKKMLTSPGLSLDLRIRMVRCYIFPILLYGMESWTLHKETTKRLEAFEMWVYRRMLRIPWTDKITNIDVLRRMGKDTEILFTVKERKLQYLGHISRNQKYGLLQLIIQGKIQGKRNVGRRRISWLRNLREWFGVSSTDLFRSAISKVRIATMISNLRRRS